MMEVLGTGMSGLVGSRVIELLPQIKFRNLSLETGFDITDREKVIQTIRTAREPVILHMAAYTDVDGAEKDKANGETGVAWKVNVLATKYLAEACQTAKKRLIYISTDFVFDGTKEEYHETDTPNPISWYGMTKFEGEKLVSIVDRHVILRISYPYRSAWAGKPDFIHRILARFKENQPVSGVADQTFVPTFIDDIARTLGYLFQNHLTGIVHAVGNEAISPLEAVKRIARRYGISAPIIEETTAADYYQGQAKRPLHAVLKNDTMTKSGLRMVTFTDGLNEIFRQEQKDNRL